MAIFPSKEWLTGLEAKINSDERYNEIAKNWEGDLFFHIEPEGNLKEDLTFYLDLWYSTCLQKILITNFESFLN